jgi:hypothetical protein
VPLVVVVWSPVVELVPLVVVVSLPVVELVLLVELVPLVVVAVPVVVVVAAVPVVVVAVPVVVLVGTDGFIPEPAGKGVAPGDASSMISRPTETSPLMLTLTTSSSS